MRADYFFFLFGQQPKQARVAAPLFWEGVHHKDGSLAEPRDSPARQGGSGVRFGISGAIWKIRNVFWNVPSAFETSDYAMSMMAATSSAVPRLSLEVLSCTDDEEIRELVDSSSRRSSTSGSSSGSSTPGTSGLRPETDRPINPQSRCLLKRKFSSQFSQMRELVHNSPKWTCIISIVRNTS